MYVTVGAAQPSPRRGIFPTSDVLSLDEATMTASAQHDVGTRGPTWPVYDAVHHVLVEASLFEAAADHDNNAMSEITVIDPVSGTVLSREPVANMVLSTVVGPNFDFTSRRGMYLDPATRTGWLINASGNGLERFHY